MNTIQKWAKRMTENMSLRMTADFYNSKEYLLTFCAYHHLNKTYCDRELKQFDNIISKSNQDAWEIALSCAKVIVFDEHENEPEFLADRKKRESLEIALAEMEMVKAGFCPPYWKNATICDRCGLMPARSKNDICSWCVSDISFSYQRAKEELKNDETL